MSSVVISGNTSGTVTLFAPDVSGNTTLTLPTSNGTVLTQNSSAPANSLVVDASGNVGIGTASPTRKLDVNGDINLVSTGVLAWGGSLNNYITGNSSSNYIAIQTNNAERMRIDSNGNVLVNTTTVVNSSRLSIVEDLTSLNGIGIKNTGTTYSASTDFIVFMNSADAAAGRIAQTAVTTVAYTTSSDYRLKENVQPMVGALEKVALLNPVTYTWKEDGSDGHGFIAHELQAVVPDAVVGEKDAVDSEGNPVYQGIDTSFLVATLTAAIKELKAIVDQQAKRIKALEGAK